jgi:hypothetical protein
MTYHSPIDYVLVSDSNIAIPAEFIFAWRARGGDVYVRLGVDVARLLADLRDARNHTAKAEGGAS